MVKLQQLTKSLGFKLGVVICLKILFLYALWYAVLQHQKVVVDTPMMTERLLTTQPER
jgi:hypothetical protein